MLSLINKFYRLNHLENVWRLGGNIFSHASGGDNYLVTDIIDSIIVTPPIAREIYGDAGGSLSGQARGGYYMISAKINAGDVIISGDAGDDLSGFAKGGNDTITGPNITDSAIVSHITICGMLGETFPDMPLAGTASLWEEARTLRWPKRPR